MSQEQNDKEEKVLINQEETAKRRISLEEAGVYAQARGNWSCHFCNKRFKSELLFMKHECKEKRRRMELQTPLGQAAFGYYNEWFRLRKFSTQSSSAFLESKYYLQFMRFAKKVQDANIANPNKFIQLMVEAENLPPAIWVTPGAYNIYQEWVVGKADPLEMVAESISYLQDISTKEEAPIETIFTHLGTQRIISLVRQNRLSPWFLFCSKKFGEALHSMPPDERKSFGNVINASFWAEKFKKNKSVVEDIKLIITGIGL